MKPGIIENAEAESVATTLRARRIGLSGAGSDLIAVMRDGGIVGLGSHEELLENNAYYRQLYDAQSEWYR